MSLYKHIFFVFILDAPTGKPKIKPSHLSKNQNEEVKFKCQTDFVVNLNPKCKRYIWNKIENNDESFPRVIEGNSFLKLKMEEKHEGQYQCSCENDFGKTEMSHIAVLWFPNSTTSSMLQFHFDKEYSILYKIADRSNYSILETSISCLIIVWLHFIAVAPMEKDMTISGLPDLLEIGTTVELTCTVPRIKPEASKMFWIIKGQRIEGSVHTSLNQDVASLIQYNIMHYTYEYTSFILIKL